MIVVVGSLNEVKIRPVHQVFAAHFPDVKVQGMSVSSGINELPLNEKEIYQGAVNRAKEICRLVKTVDYSVGIETGVAETQNHGWFEKTYVVILDKHGKQGIGISASLPMPQKIIDRILSGEEYEKIVEDIFKVNKPADGIGFFGLATSGLVTRASGTKQAVAFALAPFLFPDLYTK